MKKLIFLLPILFIGCTISQKISYKTSNLPVSQTEKLIPIMVEVRILQDNRAQVLENTILFSEPHKTKAIGDIACINAEKHYKKDSVASQITQIMVEHFNKARLFRMTYFNENIFSNYYLTGTLNRFYGEQEFSEAALVGSQFGLIGALATAGIKTPSKIIIEKVDLKLYKKDGTLIKDFGSFHKEYNEEFLADGYCWCIYRNVNEKLKEFNTLLVDKIRTDLTDVKFD